MFDNKRTPLLIARLICLIVMLSVSCQATAKMKVKMADEVPSLSLDLEGDKYPMSIQIGHHNFKLSSKVSTCRSWIKEGLCKICDKEGDNCQNNSTCLSSPKDPKISCDTAFCSRNEDFQNPAKGIYGIETQMFCTVGGSDKMLMPVVLANKISNKTDSMGEFCLLDSESSFRRGLITKQTKKIEVFNLKVKPQEQKLMKDYSFSSVATQLYESESLFGRGKSIKISNSESEEYREINLPKPTGYDLELSLDQVGISLSKSFLQELTKEIIDVYFKGGNCHFADSKIKCTESISLNTVTEAILEFQLQENFVLSLPLHLLFSSCSAKQCGIRLSSHNRVNQVIVGTVIWETIALQWDLDNKTLQVHRLNNHWASVYKADKIDLNKKGFLSNMFTFLFHIFLYIIYIIFGLAAVSLLLNFVFKWPAFLRYVRGILVKIRRRKERQIQEEDGDDDYFTGGLFEDTEIKRGRRINKLPSDIQED